VGVCGSFSGGVPFLLLMFFSCFREGADACVSVSFGIPSIYGAVFMYFFLSVYVRLIQRLD
jgi:hypothetical protein